MKKFGQHPAEFAKGKKLSLRELTTQSGVDHNKINDIELSKKGLKPETLFKLADGLAVHPKYLLEFEMPNEK